MISGLPRRRPTARPVTRPGDCEQMCDAHAAALLALADIVLDDPDEAQSAVVEVLRAAGQQQRAADDRAERRDLAAAVYVRCARSRLGPRTPDHDRQVAPGGIHLQLTGLSDQQRAGIALSMYGAHTYTDTAELLSLPPAVVAELLRSGLARLASGADPESGTA